MSPIVAIPVIALIIASLGVTVVMITQQQTQSADMSMKITEKHNSRVMEDLEFAINENGNIMVENKWSDSTKILEIRILDDGRIAKSWIVVQDISVGRTGELSFSNEVLAEWKLLTP